MHRDVIHRFLFSFVLLLFLGTCTQAPPPADLSEEESTYFASLAKVPASPPISQSIDTSSFTSLTARGRVLTGITKSVQLATANTFVVGSPKRIPIPTTLPMYEPGQDGVPLPKKVAIQGQKIEIKHPELVPALAPDYRENGQFDIQVYEVEQGLNSSSYLAILEDQRGNIWFGSAAGGLTRYYGRYFEHFTIQEGLPGNGRVTSLFEDRSGNIWIGMDDYGGILRYDGDSFLHFGEEQGIGTRVIYAIAEDLQGNLWFATESEGVIRYDGEYFYSYSTSEGLSGTDVFSIKVDQSGKVWFGTETGGVTMFDGRKFTHFTQIRDGDDDVVSAIEQDQNGHLWFGTVRSGIYRYDGKELWQYTTAEGISNNIILDILEDKQGQLWFGTRGGGAFRYNGQHFDYFREEEGLSNNTVLAMGTDRWGNIWLGTEGGGICKFTPGKFQHITKREGLKNNPVRTILQDREGQLWFGTQRGDFSRFDGQAFTHYYLEENAGSWVIASMEDRKGKLWFGTFGGGIIQYDPNLERFTQFSEAQGLSTKNVECILEDHEGNLWIGTYEGGINKFDGSQFTHFSQEDGLAGNSVISALQDRQNNLWFGTYGTGISRFDGTTFDTYTTEHGLSHNTVRVLFEDSQGYLWFGTEGGGLNRFDGTTFTQYRLGEGLGENHIRSIKEDQNGNFWVSTMNGLYYLSFLPNRAEEPQVRITRYDKTDGLKSLDFLQNSACLDESNRLWLGSNKGLTVIDLRSYQAPTKPPLVSLCQLALNERILDFSKTAQREDMSLGEVELTPFAHLPSSLTIPYAYNAPSFYFSVMDGSNALKPSFQYRLSGLAENWSPLTKDARVDYRNLSAGQYQFEVRAIGEAGFWSNVVAFPFRVRAPWWESWWAYSLYFLLAASLIYVGYRFLLNRQLEKRETENLRSLNEFKNLFYTNITHEFRTPLTIISGMIEQVQGHEKVKALIKRNSGNLLNLVNQILDLRKMEQGKLELSLSQGNIIQHLQNLMTSYEELAALKGIQLHFVPKEKEVLMDFDREKLLRIVSNLLSNAIKFTSEGGQIYVTTEITSDSPSAEHTNEALLLTVNDTGIGIPEAQQAHIFNRFYQVKGESNALGKNVGSGIGLTFTKELVSLMGGQISLQSTPNKGSSFTVRLPITRKAAMIQFDPQLPTEAVVVDHSIRPAVEPAKELTSERPFPKQTAAQTLLIIEDNPDIQHYLCSLLEDHYDIILANDGEEGIDMALEHMPSLIISDVMMRKKDGFEVCSTLKIDDRTSHIPIILLTAKAGVESRIEGLERGADAYLAKPFNEKELFVRLENLAELRRSLQQRYQSYQTSADVKLPPAPNNFEQEDAFMAKLQKAVENNLANTDFGPNQLSQALDMSRSHLHLKIKALTNRSTSIIIRTIRLHKAKELLQEGKYTVTQVAAKVGFKDLSYFSKKFTEEFGVNPQTLIPS